MVQTQKAGKVRVVFYCAAKFKGTSLNDKLLCGPDFNNNLVGVLIRFREQPIAIVSDIREMSIKFGCILMIETHYVSCGGPTT